ncbi:6-phosphogluconolactonase [Robiginitalea marina]|uniref:6-phosphogluconolactonase n=1 Tax=Robiginitalea marina TaxID=2954105 RepID=A0ABT1B179_9FLAO|nr:6-phosphogluconolactonase [Robiginitalea marina]MCO5726006.1 6-phosphogluconolactonase [Robiginitalea marina]
MEIAVYDSKLEVARALSDRLVAWNREDGLKSLALSGGSTPKIWFDVLSESYRDTLPWEELSFYWGDERCVPPGHPDSNYGMTHKHLLRKVGVPEGQIYRIRGEAPPGQEAGRYGQVLRKTLPASGGWPVLDLVVLGLGEDGHTASIFPHEAHLWDAPDCCVVATHPGSGQHRISLTGGVINQATRVVFLVTGRNKAERVLEISRGLEGSEKYPASRVAPKSGKLLWLLDADAAALLP